LAIRFAEKQDTEEQHDRKAEAVLDRGNCNLHIDELKL